MSQKVKSKKQPIVSAKEVAKLIKADGYGLIGTFFGWVILRVLKISSINTIYKKNSHLEGLDFMNGILEAFNIHFEIPDEDMKRLPKEGPYITVSNHPLGGIDGVLLLKLMVEQREDFKIIANFLLHRIAPLEPYIMPVNPFEDHQVIKSSMIGFKQALQHLKDGHPLGIFPAGEVSTYKDGKLIVDKPWEVAVMKLARRSEVPIVPIYFHAKNSRLFYWLSRISDKLRTAKLPSELFTQKHRTIKVRIGKPISVNEQSEHDTLDEFTDFVRSKTYMLSKAFDDKEKIISQISSTLRNPILKSPKQIAGPGDPEAMIREVAALRENDGRLLKSRNYEVFLAEAEQIPNLLLEIGRQREITFRAIGEGTNKALDLDDYDQYYHHLFLWECSYQSLFYLDKDVLFYFYSNHTSHNL